MKDPVAPVKTIRSAIRFGRRILRMIEDGFSVRRLARPLSCSDPIVSRFWEQWFRYRSNTSLPDTGCLRQTNSKKDRRATNHARVAPTSLATIQTQVAPSLQARVSPFCCKAPCRWTFGIAIPIISTIHGIISPLPQFKVTSRLTGLDSNRLESGCLQE